MAECRPRVSTRSAKLCAIAGPASGHAALSDRISGSNELQLISGLRNDEPQRETSVAQRRQPQAKPEHIRGTVKSLQDGVLTVATSNGSMPIRIEPSTLIDRMVRSDRAQIAEGSYLGIVSVSQADGSQRGVEVLLFSEALRGQAEGIAPWDWPGAQTTGMSDGRSPDRCVRLRRRHARRRESADRGSRFGGQRRSRVADLVAVPMRSCSKYDGLETSYPTRVLPRGAIAHGTP